MQGWTTDNVRLEWTNQGTVMKDLKIVSTKMDENLQRPPTDFIIKKKSFQTFSYLTRGYYNVQFVKDVPQY